MMASVYDYLDRRVVDLPDDDVFLLSAARAWVFAIRHGRCAQAMLRSGFAAHQVSGAMLAFLCAMTLVDRHGHGLMRFAPVSAPHVSDDEARLLTMFAAARVNDPRRIAIAAGLVCDDMAIQLAGAADRLGEAMRLRT
jgi:hypothetical protein